MSKFSRESMTQRLDLWGCDPLQVMADIMVNPAEKTQDRLTAAMGALKFVYEPDEKDMEMHRAPRLVMQDVD